MMRYIRLGAASFGLIASSALGIEFKLKELSISSLDGTLIDLYFPHGESRVFYRPPGGWSYEQSATLFAAKPPHPLTGQMTLRARKAIPGLQLPGTEEDLKNCRRLFAKLLPNGAQAVTDVSAGVEKLGGRELPLTQVTFDYEFSGVARRVRIAYALFRPELWIEIRIDSLREDFVKVSSGALLSLEGFTEVPPEPPKQAQSESGQ